MKKRLAKPITLISLVLFCAVALLAIRSFFVMDHLSKASFNLRTPQVRGVDLNSFNGNISIYWTHTTESATREAVQAIVASLDKHEFEWMHRTEKVPFPIRMSGLFQFRYYHHMESNRQMLWDRRGLMIPYGPFLILFAAVPLIRGAILLRRRQRKMPGQCPTCGYDLRATPDRCPERGTLAAARAV